MNKQPFYHKAVFLFTATEDISDVVQTEEFKTALNRFMKKQFGREFVEDSAEVDDCDAEPGDPADLL